MDSAARRHGAAARTLLLLAALLAASVGPAAGQPSSPSDGVNGYYARMKFNPSMAIVIVVLITAFIFLAFFSIYLRQCAGDPASSARRGNSIRGAFVGLSRPVQQRGLDAAVVASFPTMNYADVKNHHDRSVPLECAVCLSEFEDEERLKLLPKCNHVFHPDCIDTWLAGHVTCPVCRANLVPEPKDAVVIPVAADADDVQVQERTDQETATISAGGGHADEETRRVIEEEAAELDRIGSVKRALRSKSTRRPPKLQRSHSTGHSLAAAPRSTANVERYTLRLPGNVLSDIIAAGELRRTTSVGVFRLEGSFRRGSRAGSVHGEGSSRGRSIRLGRSEGWPAALMRSLSSRWGGGGTKSGETPAKVDGPTQTVNVP